jgi:beta-glucosidase
MTRTEKLGVVEGMTQSWGTPGDFDLVDGYYVGEVNSISRLGVPAMTFNDAQSGFRTWSPDHVGTATSWPCMASLSSTWNADLAMKMGAAIGKEFRDKGANGLLGPGVDIVRVASAGRNGESLSGEDGFLGAPLAGAYVKGVQSQGVAAVIKHFLGNMQEKNRDFINVVIDDRTLFEVHYPPFEAAIAEGVASIMCSYNRVNSYYACNNKHLLVDHLKGDLNFTGWVMSDWWAIKATGSTAADNGLDQNMPGTLHFFDKNGISETKLDDMAKRILGGMIGVGAFDWETPACVAPLDATCTQLQMTDTTSSSNTALAREVAAEGAILLKNDGTLPLTGPKKIKLVGSACDAVSMTGNEAWFQGDYYTTGGSSRVIAPATTVTTIKEGLEAVSGVTIVSSEAEADVVVGCGAVTSGEFGDRSTLKVDQHDELMGISTTKPLVILTIATGPILTDFSASANALVHVFQSGQETGNAFADVLFGAVNPSGKLPVTFPKTETDTNLIAPCQNTDCPQDEKLVIGWKRFIGKPTAYPFGHGLSYTSWTFAMDKAPMQDTATGSVVFTVKATNAGSVAGKTVAQVYVTLPDYSSWDEPQYLLKAYKKTPVVQPGASAMLKFTLTGKALSIYQPCTNTDGYVDEVAKKAYKCNAAGNWMQLTGAYTIKVGTSSTDFKLSSSLNIVGNVVAPPAPPAFPLGSGPPPSPPMPTPPPPSPAGPWTVCKVGTCTETVWNTAGSNGYGSCGEQITWVHSSQWGPKLPIDEACALVATQDGTKDECVKCGDPSVTYKLAPPSPRPSPSPPAVNPSPPPSPPLATCLSVNYNTGCWGQYVCMDHGGCSGVPWGAGCSSQCHHIQLSPPPSPPGVGPWDVCVTQTCTETVWNTQASNGHGACGGQITWVKNNMGKTWSQACEYVAQQSSTPECKDCDPNSFLSGTGGR